MGKWRGLAEQTYRDLEERKQSKEDIKKKGNLDIDVMQYQRRARYMRHKSKLMYQSGRY